MVSHRNIPTLHEERFFGTGEIFPTTATEINGYIQTLPKPDSSELGPEMLNETGNIWRRRKSLGKLLQKARRGLTLSQGS